jgi:hypothetical protein
MVRTAVIFSIAGSSGSLSPFDGEKMGGYGFQVMDGEHPKVIFPILELKHTAADGILGLDFCELFL